MREILSDIGGFLLLLFFGFIVISYLMTVFSVIVDVFRDTTLSGGKKALWLIFIWFVPFIALIAYLVTRGAGMAERSQAAAMANEQAVRAYIRDAASTSVTSEIAAAQKLRSEGAITDAEFEAMKAKILA